MKLNESPTAPTDICIMRIPISLPCAVPVSPGTPDTDAPIEQRTEVCAVDGFWMVEKAIMCDLHLRAVFGDGPITEMGAAPYDGMPWAERHRYSQDDACATLFEGHPLARSS